VSTKSGPSFLCPQPSMAPTSYRVKAQVLPAGPACPLPASLLPLSLSLPLLQPHRPPPCSSNTPGSILLQGLCMVCALCLLSAFPSYPHASLSHHLLIFSQMSPL
jgi:hypothetical protein